MEFLTDPKFHSTVLMVLGGLSLFVPGLRWVASLTKNTTDDKIVNDFAKFLETVASALPRITIGKGK